jgi:GR25 family glycosyltransferase involved in LPS biosynthesis
MNILNSHFDEIIIINLKRRLDRWYECENILKSNGIVATRFEATDGKSIDNISHLPKGKINDIGCTTSHLRVIEYCKSKNLKNALILEDDFEFIEDFFEKYPVFYEQLPDDWDWLYFSGSHLENPSKLSENVYKVSRTLTLHAYAIKENMYDILIDTIKTSLDESYDSSDLSLSGIQKNYNCYIFLPHLIYQRNGYSDIQEKEVFYIHLKKTNI